MPGPETSDLLQRAVLWAAASYSRHAGHLKVSDVPVDVDVRWTWSGTLKRGAGGGAETFDATVACHRRIDLGGVMWLGRTEDLRGTEFEEQPEPLMEVVRESITWDAKGRAQRYEYGLMRFRGALPAQETTP